MGMGLVSQMLVGRSSVTYYPAQCLIIIIYYQAAIVEAATSLEDRSCKFFKHLLNTCVCV